MAADRGKLCGPSSFAERDHPGCVVLAHVPEKLLPVRRTVLKATQGQIDGFFSQLPYKCNLEEVASVGD